MSTFKGIVEEFPEIRIDYFRTTPGRMPPLACFLSHVHSDHLQGLESLKSPFIYCSAVTRELLLRLERYPHRINFAKGTLETRRQHYKHLKGLLKTIPLNSPTEIELCLENSIRVTLFDANHCAGAVMFLIESNAKAVLYTGDIRSEPWWVNTIIRNPIVVPYVCGLRRLDKIYLDTTFASKSDRHRAFPTKAEGLSELLTKVSKYPTNTIFHFNAWTLGYEEVWIALASALKSQIHLDQYKMRLYDSLNVASIYDGSGQGGAALCGFQCGNRHQPGYLTSDPKARLHSCERDMDCPGLESASVVCITPIITHLSDGAYVPEIGAGGGEGDLIQAHELELKDADAAIELMKLCSENIKNEVTLEKTLNLISNGLKSARKTLSLRALKLKRSSSTMPLKELAEILSSGVPQVASMNRQNDSIPTQILSMMEGQGKRGSEHQLPQEIKFPYSRHSSYDELCHLVRVFEPIDIYPCSIDEASWTWDISIESLFGHLCSGTSFAHDNEMLLLQNQRAELQTCRKNNVGAPNLVDLDTLSQKRVDSANDQKDLGSRQLKRPLPDSARVQKHQSPMAVTIKVGSERRTMRTALSSGARHYARRLGAIKGSFEAWLNQPEIYNASFKPAIYDAVPQGSKSTSSDSISQYRSAPEPESPGTALKLLSKTAKDKTQFECGWVKCSDGFEVRSLLRKHVIESHLAKTSVRDYTIYSCLWRGCNSSNNLLFLSQSSWEDHLDREHGLEASIDTACSEPRFTFETTGVSRAAQHMLFKDSSVAKDKAALARCGTQSRPIEIFDGSALKQDSEYEGLDRDGRITTLEAREASIDETQVPESQLSLSDSAFESQTSHHDGPKTSFKHVQHRKEAYRAATRQRGFSWETDNGLISSSGGHGTEEIEL